jgi:hypothetical protein
MLDAFTCEDSGHGAQVPDKDGDEEDGLDESESRLIAHARARLKQHVLSGIVIIPSDEADNGYILDDVRRFRFK